jgi:fermentation-respiration switch protein FrsA (DUF1100 family)
MSIHESQIILFGRSIGTGPATLVASLRKPCALILMSPFRSVRDVVADFMGQRTSLAVADCFNNEERMHSVTCPLFVVHGQRDQLINFKHSAALVSKARGPSTLVLPRMMDHNCFDF